MYHISRVTEAFSCLLFIFLKASGRVYHLYHYTGTSLTKFIILQIPVFTQVLTSPSQGPRISLSTLLVSADILPLIQKKKSEMKNKHLHVSVGEYLEHRKIMSKPSDLHHIAIPLVQLGNERSASHWLVPDWYQYSPCQPSS